MGDKEKRWQEVKEKAPDLADFLVLMNEKFALVDKDGNKTKQVSFGKVIFFN